MAGANATRDSEYLSTPLMRAFGCPEMPEPEFKHLLGRNLEAYTYFAQGKWTRRIKIGRTREPWRRVRELINARNGEEADLLVVLRGEDFERAYHAAFAAHADGSEWFTPHPDILVEIGRLRSAPHRRP